MALKKFCAHCGCNRLIDSSERYCTLHLRDKNDSDKDYDKSQRNKEAKAYKDVRKRQQMQAILRLFLQKFKQQW